MSDDDDIRARAAERAARYRERNAADRVPDSRQLDAAIADGLRAFLSHQFNNDAKLIAASPGMRLLMRCVRTAIEDSGFNADSELTRSKLRHRLRGGGRPIRRPPLDQC